MKVLFLKTPGTSHMVLTPVGLVQLATCCKEIAEVEVLDCLKEGYTSERFEAAVQGGLPDVAAISAFSTESSSALECARILKRLKPDVVTILGGSHLHNLHHSTGVGASDMAFWSAIDYTVTGEAEHSLPLLLTEVQKPAAQRELHHIRGLGYRSGGQFIQNPPEFIEDLDSIPICDWTLVDLNSYPQSYLTKRHPSTLLMTSRGCPYPCTFCSIPSVAGKKFRARSPEHLVAEMKALYNQGVREIMFWDDNFTLQKDRALRICDLLIKEGMDLTWSCPQGVRIDLVDEELISKMKQAGCYYVALGIESGSDRVLKDMKKRLTVSRIKETVPMIHKGGINTWGFFILGYPTETREDILKTIKLAKQLSLFRASFHLFQPVPGTESYEQFVTDREVDWNKIKWSESNFAPDGMTKEELIRLQRRALFEFYTQPRVFIRFLRDNLAPRQFIELARLFKEYFLHLR